VASTPVVADVIPLNTLNRVGTAVMVGSTLRLTDTTDPGLISIGPTSLPPAGAAWTPAQYNVAAPFSVNFQFQMSDPCIGNGLNGSCIDDLGHGGDGIAFLIQNSAQGTSAIGEGASGMGFLGITDSVAVMLDTYQNNSPNYYGDPSNNYISVNTMGTAGNVPHHFCMDVNGTLELTDDPSIGTDQPARPCTVNPTLGMTGYGGVPPLSEDIDSGVHDVEVVYSGSNPGERMLDIYLDSTLVLAVSIDLATTLDLQGGDDAFLGFTAGTRYGYQNQDILSLSESPIPEPLWGQLWVPLAMLLAVALGRKFKRARP
jgi:hypothetical protein